MWEILDSKQSKQLKCNKHPTGGVHRPDIMVEVHTTILAVPPKHKPNQQMTTIKKYTFINV